MIGLDTNILVRYFVHDEPVQAARATEIIERQLSEDDPGFISVVALAELSWVLERTYNLDDGEIAAVLERVLSADVLFVESEREVFTAMIALRQGEGSFADALIAGLGTKAGCSSTLTFDRKALRIANFELA